MPIEISAEVQIAAPPERVWAVLTDLSSYRQWHPVFVSVNGELAAGSKLTITTTHPTTGRTMNAKVTVQTVEPGTGPRGLVGLFLPRETEWMRRWIKNTAPCKPFVTT